MFPVIRKHDVDEFDLRVVLEAELEHSTHHCMPLKKKMAFGLLNEHTWRYLLETTHIQEIYCMFRQRAMNLHVEFATHQVAYDRVKFDRNQVKYFKLKLNLACSDICLCSPLFLSPTSASFEIVDVAVTALIKEGVSLRIENIEIDATETEQKRFKDHPARSGLPYAIDSKFTVKRGISKAQSYLYPEMWRTPGKKISEHLLTELVLKDISYTHRALILDLGPLFLMFQNNGAGKGGGGEVAPDIGRMLGLGTNGSVNYTEDIPGCGVGCISKQWCAAEDPFDSGPGDSLDDKKPHFSTIPVPGTKDGLLCQGPEKLSKKRKDLEVEWPMSAQNEHPYGTEVSRSIWGEIIVGDSSHWKKEHLEEGGRLLFDSGPAGWVTVQPFNQHNPPLNGTGQHVPLVIQVAPAVNQPIQSYTGTGFTKGPLLAIPYLSVPSSFR
ncbi:hypothetical protein B0H10DRAFT_1939281 [Mycena sp. CBHHK59/15]|nr:hypothetical protein B0H10DRAFT_1939281 [Mycena sp. CBHHK59/15]